MEKGKAPMGRRASPPNANTVDDPSEELVAVGSKRSSRTLEGKATPTQGTPKRCSRVTGPSHTSSPNVSVPRQAAKPAGTVEMSECYFAMKDAAERSDRQALIREVARCLSVARRSKEMAGCVECRALRLMGERGYHRALRDAGASELLMGVLEPVQQETSTGTSGHGLSPGKGQDSKRSPTLAPSPGMKALQAAAAELLLKIHDSTGPDWIGWPVRELVSAGLSDIGRDQAWMADGTLEGSGATGELSKVVMGMLGFDGLGCYSGKMHADAREMALALVEAAPGNSKEHPKGTIRLLSLLSPVLPRAREVALALIPAWFGQGVTVRAAKDLLGVVCGSCRSESREDLAIVMGVSRLQLRQLDRSYLNDLVVSLSRQHQSYVSVTLRELMLQELNSHKPVSLMKTMSVICRLVAPVSISSTEKQEHTREGAIAEAVMGVIHDASKGTLDGADPMIPLMIRRLIRAFGFEIVFEELCTRLLDECTRREWIGARVAMLVHVVCAILLTAAQKHRTRLSGPVHSRTVTPVDVAREISGVVACVQRDAVLWSEGRGHEAMQYLSLLLFLEPPQAYEVLREGAVPVRTPHIQDIIPESSVLEYKAVSGPVPVHGETLAGLVRISRENSQALDFIDALVCVKAAAASVPDPLISPPANLATDLLQLANIEIPPGCPEPTCPLADVAVFWRVYKVITVLISISSSFGKALHDTDDVCKALLSALVTSEFGPLSNRDDSSDLAAIQLEQKVILEYERDVCRAQGLSDNIETYNSKYLGKLMLQWRHDSDRPSPRPPSWIMQDLQRIDAELNLSGRLRRRRDLDVVSLATNNAEGGKDKTDWVVPLLTKDPETVHVLSSEDFCTALQVVFTGEIDASVRELVVKALPNRLKDGRDSLHILERFLPGLHNANSAIITTSKTCLAEVFRYGQRIGPRREWAELYMRFRGGLPSSVLVGHDAAFVDGIGLGLAFESDAHTLRSYFNAFRELISVEALAKTIGEYVLEFVNSMSRLSTSMVFSNNVNYELLLGIVNKALSAQSPEHKTVITFSSNISVSVPEMMPSICLRIFLFGPGSTLGTRNLWKEIANRFASSKDIVKVSTVDGKTLPIFSESEALSLFKTDDEFCAKIAAPLLSIPSLVTCLARFGLSSQSMSAILQHIPSNAHTIKTEIQAANIPGRVLDRVRKNLANRVGKVSLAITESIDAIFSPSQITRKVRPLLRPRHEWSQDGECVPNGAVAPRVYTKTFTEMQLAYLVCLVFGGRKNMNRAILMRRDPVLGEIWDAGGVNECLSVVRKIIRSEFGAGGSSDMRIRVLRAFAMAVGAASVEGDDGILDDAVRDVLDGVYRLSQYSISMLSDMHTYITLMESTRGEGEILLAVMDVLIEEGAAYMNQNKEVLSQSLVSMRNQLSRSFADSDGTIPPGNAEVGSIQQSGYGSFMGNRKVMSLMMRQESTNDCQSITNAVLRLVATRSPHIERHVAAMVRKAISAHDISKVTTDSVAVSCQFVSLLSDVTRFEEGLWMDMIELMMGPFSTVPLVPLVFGQERSSDITVGLLDLYQRGANKTSRDSAIKVLLGPTDAARRFIVSTVVPFLVGNLVFTRGSSYNEVGNDVKINHLREMFGCGAIRRFAIFLALEGGLSRGCMPLRQVSARQQALLNFASLSEENSALLMSAMTDMIWSSGPMAGIQGQDDGTAGMIAESRRKVGLEWAARMYMSCTSKLKPFIDGGLTHCTTTLSGSIGIPVQQTTRIDNAVHRLLIASIQGHEPTVSCCNIASAHPLLVARSLDSVLAAVHGRLAHVTVEEFFKRGSDRVCRVALILLMNLDLHCATMFPTARNLVVEVLSWLQWLPERAEPRLQHFVVLLLQVAARFYSTYHTLVGGYVEQIQRISRLYPECIPKENCPSGLFDTSPIAKAHSEPFKSPAGTTTSCAIDAANIRIAELHQNPCALTAYPEVIEALKGLETLLQKRPCDVSPYRDLIFGWIQCHDSGVRKLAYSVGLSLLKYNSAPSKDILEKYLRCLSSHDEDVTATALENAGEMLFCASSWSEQEKYLSGVFRVGARARDYIGPLLKKVAMAQV